MIFTPVKTLEGCMGKEAKSYYNGFYKPGKLYFFMQASSPNSIQKRSIPIFTGELFWGNSMGKMKKKCCKKHKTGKRCKDCPKKK